MGKLILTGNSRVRARVGGTPPATGPTLPGVILGLSPVGYWKLNETPSNGATAADSSGNSRAGTYTTSSGSPWSTQAGPDGNYADFGNSGGVGYVSVAANSVFAPGTASGLTVFALISPDSVAGTTRQMIAAKGGAGGTNYDWTFHANQTNAAKLEYDVHGSAGNGLQIEAKTSQLTTGWQAVCWSTPDVNFNTRGKLYWNSGTALTTTQGSTSNSTSYVGGATALNLGWRPDQPSGQQWQGGLAHVAIFAGQMSAGNVGTLMSAADADGWF